MALTRLAELLGRLSLAVDMADDTTPGHAIRATVLAVELGKRAGASGEELRNTYWVTLFGHSDIAPERGLHGGEYSLPGILADLTRGAERSSEGMTPNWAQADVMVLPTRLRQLAHATERVRCRESRNAAVTFAHRHAGSRFEERLVRLLDEQQDELLAAGDDPEIFTRFLELEAPPFEFVDERKLEDVAHALALLTDLRNPVFLVHSTGVAGLAERAAAQLGLGADEARNLRIAALLHDIGRVSVPNSIWTRPGPLDWSAWERIRLHPYHTARVLAPIPAFAEIADIASAAHERLDGSGYPERRSGRALSTAARVLAAAHVAFAMSEDRPHRPALGSDAIARELVAEAAAGRLDARVVDAVLTSLGLPQRASPSSSHGLSGRELEVSQLLARGKSDKEIGAALRISPRTVQVHVARILDKLGVRSRAGAAVWLIQHDLAS